MNNYSYNDIIKCFDENKWHIGYLEKEYFDLISNLPVRLGNNMPLFHHAQSEENFFVLVFVEHTLDYDYSQRVYVEKILHENFPNIKTIAYETANLKLAAVLAGLGQYGKNTLFHDDKFDFDVHIALCVILGNLIDPPSHIEPRYGYMPECQGCFDCYNACPSHALHNIENPNYIWVDIFKCDDFCLCGNHPIIPSVKWGYCKIQHPWLSDQQIFNIENSYDYHRALGITIGDESTVHPNLKTISVPTCRECCSQPKCSKYNGQYPYIERIKVFEKEHNISNLHPNFYEGEN